jgi:hypothetical protein
MGIKPNQFPIIWQAIRDWMLNKGINSARLSHLTGYSKDRIENGIKNETEWITSDFLHSCVDHFGLRSSRQRGFEDTIDVLTDEECIELLTAPLRTIPLQGHLWD